MKEQLRIIIADDHPIFRSGLRQVIESEPLFNVVGEADNGEKALQFIEKNKPDVIILDVNMPILGGFAVLKEMRLRNLSGAVIFLTMHNEEKMFNKAMELGVKGYILKDDATIEIVNCIKVVNEGRHCASPAVTSYLFNRLTQTQKNSGSLEDLTPTERTILRLIAEYKTSREIADELSISHRTVENHRYNICHKLDVSGSNALVKFALKHQGEI